MADKYKLEKQEVAEEGCEWWWPKNWTAEGVKSVILITGYAYITYQFVKRSNEMSV